jgi:hypothetical protein
MEERTGFNKKGMKVIKRLGILICIAVLLAMWGIGILFGWLWTGRNVMYNTWVDNKLEALTK